MNRFSAALELAKITEPELLDLIGMLYLAAIESSAYGINPRTDPAVILIAKQVSFMTNAECMTTVVYDKLIKRCVMSAGKPNIDPLEVH